MNIRARVNRRYGIFILGCAALALMSATPAITLAATMVPDIAVRFDDLDIDTAKGAKKLLNRISSAAASVCEQVYTGTPSSKSRRDHCILQVTAETVAKVNRPALLAAHQASLKRSKVAVPG
jgi:UrcA family protein